MIYINKTASTSYYLQIYRHILDNILSGKYPAGYVLPGSRILAADVGVGRNTVDNAYAQLAAEGYIKATAGLGFRVLSLPELLLEKGKKRAVPELPAGNSSQVPVLYDLFYGSLSNQDFPLAAWKKCTLEVLAEENSSRINIYPGNKGDYELRSQLSSYLFETRGVNCTPEQILITPGLQGSLEVLCKLLYPEGGSHGFEEPGYDKALFIFQRHGIKTVLMDSDDAGAIPESLHTDRKIRSIYLTPSHQFPMGTIMSIGRRYEFLNWAIKNNAYIIEDDYDSDYSYYTNPIPAFQSIDTSGRVIYLGNFSKTLSPSMRMGYLILPAELAERYEREMAKYNCMVPWLMQRILARFIAQGHYRRLVRKLRTKYKSTHDLLLKEIRRMSPDIQVISEGSGLKFLLEFPRDMHRDWLMDTAREHGVKVYSPERFWQRKELCPPNLIMIGFTAIEPEEILPCMEILKKVWFPASECL